MPASRESYRLAQAQRRAQLGIREEYMAEAALLWPLFTRAATREDMQRWLQLSTRLIHRFERMSWTLATRYYGRAHSLDAPGVPAPRPPSFEPQPDRKIVRDLLDRGPGTVKRARLRGISEQQAEDRALANTLASGARLVLNGGRNAVQVGAETDRTALGFMRVSDGDPCYFCAMLVSRGAVYSSEDTAGRDANNRFLGPGLFKFHDHCGCTVAPAFTRDEFVSDEAKQYRDIWSSTVAGYHGAEARNAFRRRLAERPEEL